MDKALLFARIKESGGKTTDLAFASKEGPGYVDLTLSKQSIPVDFVEISLLPTLLSRLVGDKGHYVLPRSGSGSIVSFLDHKPSSRIIDASFLPICGGVFEDQSILIVLEGMKWGCEFSLSLKDGEYSLYPLIRACSSHLYEDISLRLYFLTEADRDYSAMARLYRQHKLDRGEVSLLRDKALTRPLLDYLIHAPEIRVRMGWKPAPPHILHQTLENEPEMFVAATFDRVGELMDALKSRGLEKAEFCLVGWNKSGHDGRWPDIFPIEPKLGGEDGLKRLIVKAKSLGYKLVCHTNSTDSYEIAESFSHQITLKNRLNESVTTCAWSGGQMFELCPQKALEFAEHDLPLVRELGFEGDHYIDVIATISPRECNDPQHPVNKGQCVHIWNRILSYAASLFGGISSEGAFDFSCGVLDFGLYTCFDLLKPLEPLEERRIPLWQLVYHGIVLSNPSATTINYPIKSADSCLTFYEYGGRPTAYVYSAFFSGNNWMGADDLTMGNQEELSHTADAIVSMTKEYLPVAELQYETMDSHTLLKNGLVEITYSNGAHLVINYTDDPLPYQDKAVNGKSMLWEVPPCTR